MISVLLGSVWPYILAAGGVLLGLVGKYLRGRKDASDKAEKRAADEYIKTRREIDNADLGIGATDDGRIKRLHDIADRKRGGGS
jgi:hypothetical protein